MERSEKRALYALGNGTFDKRSPYARAGRLALEGAGYVDGFELTASGRELFATTFQTCSECLGTGVFDFKDAFDADATEICACRQR